MRISRSEEPHLAELARVPWVLPVGRHALLVRPSTARDLAAVARMHSRCSARALLDRYHGGGRPPAVAAMDTMLRNRHSVVAVFPTGAVVALGTLRRDPTHHDGCAEVGLLVEDRWQRMGIGTELTSHLAGAAQASGYRELIAYPATSMAVAQRLMLEVGHTRVVRDVQPHLHTYLSGAATLGIGSVRQRLAG